VRIARALITAVAICCCACAGSATTGTEPEPVQQITERRVDPSATGAGISNATGQHFVIAPAESLTGKLVVFLPGTGGRPDFYKTFLRLAGTRGYHAIGIAYPNAEAVNDLCAANPSPTCHEDVRVEVITGAPRSALVNVNLANSIDNRLREVLLWLDRSFPGEGWSAFLSNVEPRWDRVIVAGHSQGGGHAGMIARLRLVDRAVLFSSTEPAPWTTASFVTPTSQLYGFVHRSEGGYTGITSSWRLMRFSGSLTTVDGATPPFGGSHQLQTSSTTCRAFAPRDSPHNCVVTDEITPLEADGQPSFGPAWTYLLGG
jgi:pimeloyl-ACP methyl ester carboxylesterase